ncbi:unnamed protein product [Rotaria sp. Silwood1]|nr:unnamed protein product [Rotaria sp. Silwood1]CAF3719675.1 unnamed protein product [Rotaria sp. Silwood1]CAF3790415.1 unnamed protein product [Rotaria sp. Silwood1]CAF4692226.1 unnamed protein product [Rotaria sp. Silwood1]CAF4973370.1 unnamed protein product [Rotaria sp. Silwood1]
MECDMNDLNAILMCLFGESSIQVDDPDVDHNVHISCKTEPMEVPTVSEPPSPSTVTKAPTSTTADRQRQQFCLVIFNNPRWSRILHRRQGNIPNQSNQPEQVHREEQHQTARSPINQTVQSSVKNEEQDTSLDDQFIIQLKQLIQGYMQHTTRPLPLKYFLDLTEQ